jgi:hypothetical protein
MPEVTIARFKPPHKVRPVTLEEALFCWYLGSANADSRLSVFLHSCHSSFRRRFPGHTVIGVFADKRFRRDEPRWRQANPPLQARHVYFGWRVTMTWNWADVTRSSPIKCMAPRSLGRR